MTEPGYYWVKLNSCWKIAEWNVNSSGLGLWYFIADEVGFERKHIEEIGRRISNVYHEMGKKN